MKIAGIAMLWVTASVQAQDCRVVAVSPSQPQFKIEEGERAVESETFPSGSFAISPSNAVHYFDTASRIRRIEPNGRIATLAGNGTRTEQATLGPARDSGLPAIGQIVFSPDGTLHFSATGRVYRLNNDAVEAVAGSGRPGFNVESGAALDVNLGGIVNIAFDRTGSLLIIDGFGRARKLESDGTIRTVAGSARTAATNGLTGDNGPATQAALSSPRQVVPLPDGSLWIKDLSGRHLRLVTQDGTIRTINTNFDAAINILMLADGTPAAATANRVYPLRSNGNIETGANPFPPFTGTPIAVGPDGALYFTGSTRPDQRNPLIRLSGGKQAVIAGAPVAPTVDGQAPPFGVWHPRLNSLIYSASQGGKSGILEARPGQPPRFFIGGGDDVGDPDGKTATSLTIFGIVAFTIDGEGRAIVADVFRRRILVIDADGKISVLKTAAGPVVYAPLGSLSTLQRIAADARGNIYWFSQGATPTGGIFTADISMWDRAASKVTSVTVPGLSALIRLDDGSVGVIAGIAANYRSVLTMQGDAASGLRLLPLQSVSRFQDRPYFTAASRLFRGDPGKIEFLDLLLPAAPDFVLASLRDLYLHLTDGGFYRLENLDACRWLPQPAVTGLANAASGEFRNMISPRELITVYGSGLGPAEGQGVVLDGFLRASGQPAPFPALTLGNFSGTTLTGTVLPVVHSNDKQVTVQAVSGIPASGEYLLYFTWQGLQLIQPGAVKVATATPGLFARDGVAAAINEDGTANGVQNPAAVGSVLRLFGTGFGATSGTLATGEFYAQSATATLVNALAVTIGGKAAEVIYAGGAPGMIGGVIQADVRVPADLAPGAHAVTFEVTGQPATATQQVSMHVR